jgi:hypothetical protein
MIDLDISKDIAEFVGDELRTLAIDIDRRIVMAMPFRDGGAKRNVLASVGSPDNSEIDIAEGVSKGEAEQSAINQGAITISGANDYETIYLNLNFPYAVRLNEGWSEQAPSGFIDKIITEEVARGGN